MVRILRWRNQRKLYQKKNVGTCLLTLMETNIDADCPQVIAADPIRNTEAMETLSVCRGLQVEKKPQPSCGRNDWLREMSK